MNQVGEATPHDFERSPDDFEYSTSEDEETSAGSTTHRDMGKHPCIYLYTRCIDISKQSYCTACIIDSANHYRRPGG